MDALRKTTFPPSANPFPEYSRLTSTLAAPWLNPCLFINFRKNDPLSRKDNHDADSWRAFFAAALIFSTSLLAQPQAITIDQGAQKFKLELPEDSRLRFGRDGSLHAERAGAAEKLLEINERVTARGQTTILEGNELKVWLRLPVQLQIIDGENRHIDYQINPATIELLENVAADSWTLHDTKLTLRLEDPSRFDSASINFSLSQQHQLVERISMELKSTTSESTDVKQSQRLVRELQVSLEKSLVGKHYEPTRRYLLEEIKNLERSIKQGDRTQAQRQSDSIERLMKSASRVISFDVRANIEEVKIELYALLDNEARKQEYTNGRMRAVVPGNYRLEARKSGWSDSTPLKMDLFRENPTSVECTMKKIGDGPSICRTMEL